MYTTARAEVIPQLVSLHFDKRIQPEDNTPWDAKTNPQGCPARTFADSLLNLRLEPLKIYLVDKQFNKASYMYLYNSAKKYVRLLGEEFTLKPNYPNFREVFNYLRDKLPLGHHLSFCENKDGTLCFLVYDEIYPDTLYGLSCNMIEGMEKKLKEIFISFFALLRESQGFTKFTDSYYYQVQVEDVLYQMECDLADQEEEKAKNKDEDVEIDSGLLENIQYLESYESGEIFDTLNLVEQDSRYTIGQLKKKIHIYLTKNKETGYFHLLELMLEGLELFKEKKSILRYALYLEGKPDDCDLYINELFSVLYDYYDMVGNDYLQIVNDRSCEGRVEIISPGSKKISPFTKKLLVTDDYPERFLHWLDKFSYELQ